MFLTCKTLKTNFRMKIKAINTMCISFILFFSFSVSYAQVSVPFKTRFQDVVRGDMTIIANSIVNRVDYNNSSNDAYYNQTKYSKLNDEFDMEYIDIDDDESTFSSSSAELVFDNKSNKKVIYAALYWSANYKYNVGIQKGENKFKAQDKSRDSFEKVKLKLPNQEEYIDIFGETIFDGIEEFKDFAPYAVYADITDYVTNLSSADGVYTVANIKATQGKISGGVAAGWTIFVVYEDKTMSEKFITSQDGFVGLIDKPIDITFKGYELPSTGRIKAKIAAAVLEGDNNILADKLLFSSNETNTFTSLGNRLRPENNFFNSSISIEDEYFMNRFPDSKNTLGYDSFLLTLTNQNNTKIINSSNESKLRFQSGGDNFFLFFSAFNINLSPNLEPEIVEQSEQNSKEINNQIVKFVPINNDLVADDIKTASTVNRIQKNNTLDNNFIEIQTLKSSTQPSGYYIMANIFKNEQRTQEFIFYLKTKDITADFFINPLNNYFYIYLKKLDNLEEAINLYQSKLNDTYKERMQIVSINNDFISKVKESEDLIYKKQEMKLKDSITEVEGKTQKRVFKETKPKKDIEKEVKIKKEENYYSKKLAQTIININKARALNDLHSANIPKAQKGYYIIANVFLVNENSINFINSLKSNGLQPKVLVNSTNSYRYIYLKRVDTEEEARNLLQSNFNNKYESKLWILSVNNLQTISNNDKKTKD